RPARRDAALAAGRRAEGGVPPGVRRPAGDVPDGRGGRARPAPLPARSRKEEVMAFEALKERQSVMWGSGPSARIAASIEDLHASVAGALAAQAGERALDLG